MAKFTHLPRQRRFKPKHQSKSPQSLDGQDLHSFSDNKSTQHQQSLDDITEAEILINRVSGACGSKAAYATRSEVSTFLRQSGFTGMPYPCQFCNFWHVTTMPKKAQKTLMRQIRAAQELLNSTTPPR